MMEAFDAFLSSAPPLRALLGLAVGIILGFAYFGSLWWNASFYAAGGVLKAVVLHVLRFGLLVAVFIAIARLGALALLSTALGLLIARAILLRRARSLP